MATASQSLGRGAGVGKEGSRQVAGPNSEVFLFSIPVGAQVQSREAFGALRDALAQLTFCIWMTGGALGGDRSGRLRAIVPRAQAGRFVVMARSLIAAYEIAEQ